MRSGRFEKIMTHVRIIFVQNVLRKIQDAVLTKFSFMQDFYLFYLKSEFITGMKIYNIEYIKSFSTRNEKRNFRGALKN